MEQKVIACDQSAVAGLIIYANWGSSQMVLSNGDWGDDNEK